MPELPQSHAKRIKKALVDAGFEVFRSLGEEIVLAERPRENLIMDSGVRLRFPEPFESRIVFRAQKADFPNEDDVHLFERVRKLATPALSSGFVELGTAVTHIIDPSDSERTLDTFYEVTYSKGAATFEIALVELRFAMGLEKRA